MCIYIHTHISLDTSFMYMLKKNINAWLYCQVEKGLWCFKSVQKMKQLLGQIFAAFLLCDSCFRQQLSPQALCKKLCWRNPLCTWPAAQISLLWWMVEQWKTFEGNCHHGVCLAVKYVQHPLPLLHLFAVKVYFNYAWLGTDWESCFLN